MQGAAGTRHREQAADEHASHEGRRVKVCVVGHSASGFSGGAVGGSERQSAVLARCLAARGHRVSYVVTGLAGGDRMVDGVHVRAAWDPETGVRLLRAATHRYPRLLGLLRDEAADVYYSRGSGYHTPFVVRAARDVGGISVLALASDRDLFATSGKILFAVPNKRVSSLIGPVAHAGYRRWGLRAADWVAVQNAEQAASCRAMDLRYAILPNIVEPPPPGLAAAAETRDAIWVGNVDDQRRSKGVVELVALVRLASGASFTVAGNFHGELGRAAVEAFRGLPNVDYVGRLTHAETQVAIAAHSLVINTSPSEGFSNVMLEGWSLARPSVTLVVNPDGLLTADDLGICAHGDVQSMAAAIMALRDEPAARAAMAQRCRSYVRRVHEPEGLCEAFEALVRGVD